MQHNEPILREIEATKTTARVTGFLSQRVSDGSQISLFVQVTGGGYYMVEQVTETTVALLQNALSDIGQTVDYYVVNGKVGLIFRRTGA